MNYVDLQILQSKLLYYYQSNGKLKVQSYWMPPSSNGFAL